MMRTIGARFLLGLAAFSGLAFATPNACPTATNGSGLPAVGSSSPTNQIGGSFGGNPTGSCLGVDLTFSNFSVSTVNNLNNSAYVFQSGASGAIGLTFSSERGAANVSTDGDNNDGLNNFSQSSSSAQTQNISYVVTAGATNKITEVVLSETGSSLASGGGSGSIVVDLCAGQSLTGNWTSANCTTGTFSTQTLTLPSSGSASTLGLTLASAVTTLSINNVVTLSGHGNKATSFLTFTDVIDETSTVPEPATFTLFGTALVGIGFLRYRRKKS